MSREDTAGFAEKVLMVLDGSIEAEEFARLDRLIATDAKAAQRYVDMLLIHLALSRSAGAPADEPQDASPTMELDSLLGELLSEPPLPAPLRGPRGRRRGASQRRASKETPMLREESSWAEAERVDQIRRRAQQQLEAFLQQEREQDQILQRHTDRSWDIAGLGQRAAERLDALTKAGLRLAKVAAVCLLVGVTALIVVRHFYANRVVANVVDSVHMKWDSKTKAGELRPGWTTLEEGFVQIAFKKGAEVILQAPCEFELLSSNRMALVSGRMTAKVPEEATGFAIDTPASTVVDYGTEFGVLIGTKGESEVHVFAGEVALSQSHGSRDIRRQTLHTGEAASVDQAGGVRLDTMTNRPGLFVQDLPPEDLFGIPGKRLDLADIVRGGSGFGTGRADAVICTGSGQFVWGGRWLNDEWRCAFAPVHALPYVDGVFVPDGSEGPVTVSSAGHLFGACPDTDGMMRSGFVSAGAYRRGRPFRVDLSQSGDLEPGWVDWSTGERLQNAPLTRTFASTFDSDFTVAFDRVDTRNRGQVDTTVPLHDLLDDDFKESDAVVMRLQGLEPGAYLITTYHHDPLEDSKDSDGTISITVTDAKGPRVVAQRFWQSWGPNPKVIACATFAFESDGREVVLTFRDNNDATHNEAHLNGFELDLLESTGVGQGDTTDAVRLGRQTEFEGAVFGTRAHPAIYMHANLGVTFDLERIREALSGARVVAFQAQCGRMSPPSGSTERASRAGFWVLVDGEVRFRHIEKQPAVATPVDVALSDRDRFLTLVTTDGGDGHEFDLCFFGDPALKLESAGQ